MKSIRTDLTARLLLGLGLTVIAVSLGSFLLVRRTVTREFDGSMSDKLRALGSLVSIGEDGFELDLAEQAAPEYQDVAGAEYLEIWLEDGTVVARSPSLHGSDLPQRGAEPGSVELWDQALQDGRPGRAAGSWVQVAPDDEAPAAGSAPQVLIVTARSRAGLDRALAGVGAVFGAGCVLSLLVIAGLVRSSVRRALLPVSELSARLDGIDASRLAERVPQQGVPEELAFIPGKLNALLQRLEQAFERERRMTGNLAHELRTPLAELRTATDIAQRWRDDQALAAQALATGHDVALRMGRLVDALLRLSRVAAGQASLQHDDVAVAATVAELWRPVAGTARERRLGLQLDVPDGLMLRTDRDLFGVALGNLLGNAVEHGAAGEPIRCTAAPRDGGLRLTLANGANGLRAEDLPHLAEPFWRADRSRSDNRHGGLGLALADAIADVLGARLSFELQDGQFRAHLDLPAGRHDAAPDHAAVTLAGGPDGLLSAGRPP